MKNRLKAFSLLEIVIGLLVVSLLLAAFAPVISKRLKNSSVTVGFGYNRGNSSDEKENPCEGKECSAGYWANKYESCKCSPCSAPFCQKCENNECQECLDGYTLVDGECKGGTKSCMESGGKPTQACCESVGAVYLPKATTGLGLDLCMMKYNAFDGPIEGLEASQNLVKIVNRNQICSIKSCCWKGSDSIKTSSSCTVGSNGDSSYSGCTRTICQATAADKICANWAPSNYAPGAWRLPTSAELTALKNHISDFSTNQGSSGLQLCDSSSSTGIDKCSVLSGTSIKACGISSAEEQKKDDCFPNRIWGQSNSYLNLSGGSATVGTETDAYYNPKSVRCVSDSILKTDTIDQTIDGISTDEVEKYQKICDKYNALFIPKKYLGTSKNICMTKYNALDANGPMYDYTDEQLAALNPAVKRVKRDKEYCSTGYCCWGNAITSGSYTVAQNGDSVYSGGTRTVCQATAAASICSNWAPDTTTAGKWRLASLVEFENIARYINYETNHSQFLNLYRGKSGLQLCDSSSSTGIDKCSVLSGTSIKACGISSGEENTKDDCAPYGVWGLSNIYLKMSGNVASVGTEAGAYYYPKSVRCVTEAGVN